MTIRLSRQESVRVATLARKRRITRSDLIRLALAQLDSRGQKSALDELQTLVGNIKNGPRDLATNRKYLKGFGR